MKKKILLIEDDPAIVSAVELAFGDLEFSLRSVTSGKEGLETALRDDFDVVIVDVMLPEMNGFDICRKLRESKPLQPILILTGCRSEVDVVVGLEHGADDYLVKPFKVRELLARVRVMMRRSAAERELLGRVPGDRGDASHEIRSGLLCIDVGSRLVTVDGEGVELTRLEFELLLYLIQNEEKAVSRADILEIVWGYQAGDYDVTLNSQVSKLRKKLGPAGDYIETVRGFGYRFRSGNGQPSPASGVLE